MDHISSENIDIKHISIDDMRYIERLLNQKMLDITFAKKVVFHQLQYPKLDYKDFKSTRDELLVELVELLLKKECEIIKYYTNSGNIFKDFKQAISMENVNNTEQLGKALIRLLTKYNHR